MAITDPKTQPADGFQQLWSFGIECMCSNIYKSSFRYENVIMNWINITCQLLFQFAEQYLLTGTISHVQTTSEAVSSARMKIACTLLRCRGACCCNSVILILIIIL